MMQVGGEDPQRSFYEEWQPSTGFNLDFLSKKQVGAGGDVALLSAKADRLSARLGIGRRHGDRRYQR